MGLRTYLEGHDNMFSGGNLFETTIENNLEFHRRVDQQTNKQTTKYLLGSVDLN